MTQKKTRRTLELKNQILREYDALQGIGSVAKRAALAEKYGFHTMRSLYNFVNDHRRWLRDKQRHQADGARMASGKAPVDMPPHVAWAMDWLLNVEATLGREGLTTDMLLAHLARYSRR